MGAASACSVTYRSATGHNSAGWAGPGPRNHLTVQVTSDVFGWSEHSMVSGAKMVPQGTGSPLPGTAASPVSTGSAPAL